MLLAVDPAAAKHYLRADVVHNRRSKFRYNFTEICLFSEIVQLLMCEVLKFLPPVVVQLHKSTMDG